jgi:hypothetical protein
MKQQNTIIMQTKDTRQRENQENEFEISVLLRRKEFDRFQKFERGWGVYRELRTVTGCVVI